LHRESRTNGSKEKHSANVFTVFLFYFDVKQGYNISISSYFDNENDNEK